MAQIWANADFRGMPIESARDRKLSPRERYTGSTSLLAKSVGGALNLSPKQIDFLGNNTLDAAGEMAKNNALIKMGAATTKEYKRYEDLQLYSAPVSTYLVTAAKTKDIEALKDKRTGDTLANSKGALIVEAVREMDLDLPAINRNMLLSKLGVSDTVLGWSDYKLERELRKFRRASGTE